MASGDGDRRLGVLSLLSTCSGSPFSTAPLHRGWRRPLSSLGETLCRVSGLSDTSTLAGLDVLLSVSLSCLGERPRRVTVRGSFSNLSL